MPDWSGWVRPVSVRIGSQAQDQFDDLVRKVEQRKVTESRLPVVPPVLTHRGGRSPEQRQRSRNAPLLIGVGAIPLLAVGGLLELLRSHLIEVSTVVVGLGWVALAVALRHSATAKLASNHPIAPS
jgi:hypothetical protein